MTEREIAKEILDTAGYLSKNILARKLNCTLKQARQVLETFENTKNVDIRYSRITGRNIEIFKEKLEGCQIFAVSKIKDPSAIYQAELNLKDQCYAGPDLVYPPADSGVFLQPKRESFFVTGQQSSTVKGKSRKISPPKIDIDREKIEICGVNNSVIEKNQRKPKKENLESSENKVKFEDDENTPAHERTLKRKATPHPNKDKKAKVKAAKGKVRAEKKEKPVAEYFVPTLPVIAKRKVYKTKCFFENGKLITEDYSSEEEFVINATPIPVIQKKTQTRLEFKPL